MTARTPRPRREFPHVLAGLAEIVRAVGVSKVTVRNWRKNYPDFPAPVASLDMGPVWLLEDVRAFLADHPDLGQPPVRVSEEARTAIREEITAGLADGTANVSETARKHGVSRVTVYAIADDLLFGSNAGAGV